MAVLRDLQEYLRSISAITAVVSDRIYYVRAPADADRPLIVVSRAGEERGQVQGGFVGAVATTVIVISVADTYEAAESLATLLRQALDGVQTTMNGNRCHNCHLLDTSDDYAELEGADAGRYLVLQTYTLLMQET